MIINFFLLLTCCGTSRQVVIIEKASKADSKEVLGSPKTTINSKKSLTNKEKIEHYISQFGPTAMAEMKTYGIPASITLAQGILESGIGYGYLAETANNHFGIKCHKDWKGNKIYHDDDLKGECFRVYKDPTSSYRDHSLFLKERSRYAFLFEIKITDYKEWAKGLKKAGYATDPKYPDKLIGLIERFDLTRFDIKKQIYSKDEKSIKNANRIKSRIHKVKEGDTLYSLSKKYNISQECLVEVNLLKDQTIYLGQELKIPIKK